MQENEIAHYCQKCLAANPLGEDFCFRCGTRLMIVVEPAAMRYDNAESGGAAEEHLLERISVLENRQARLTERLERALDLLLRQAQNSYLDRGLLKSLIGLLDEDGIIANDKLERLWQKRCEQDSAAQEQANRRDEARAKITGAYRGSDRRLFEGAVTEAFALFEAGNVEAGVQTLRQAIEKDPQNGALLSFLGDHYFRTGKMKLAREFLARAAAVLPKDNHVLLLLGLAYGEEGETEKAKELLETTTRRGGSSFAAHYGLGRLFVAEQKWEKALREFKLALASKPSPEANYALACLYYELGRDGLALRYLLRATEMDEGYDQAFHLLGLVYKRAGNVESARHAFQKAGLDPESLPGSGGKRGRTRALRPEPALFQTGTSKRKRFLTGGDVRLARALREDALRAFVTGDER
jgi:tetratricopeptide (TPR) repeat protein